MTDAVVASSPLRRRLVFGGVAAAAVAGGAGLAWWQLRPRDAATEAVERLWELSFPTPTGEPLAMASLRGKPLVVNFWATWCPPCVEEMPLLDAFYREHAANGWQVVGLAVDQVLSVRRFLAKLPVTFPIALAGLDGTDIARSLGNRAGGLPYTVVLDAGGQVLARRMGKVSEADLQAWAGRA